MLDRGKNGIADALRLCVLDPDLLLNDLASDFRSESANKYNGEKRLCNRE